MFAKRIGDESLGATPRATSALDAAAVGERLPLLHREGQAPDALASPRGRKSRSTAVSLAAVGGALAMVVVCGVALANSATGAKHTSELARADAAGAPASAGRLGAHARRAERREQRRARRVSLDPSAAGSLGAEAEEAEEATETEEAEPTQTPAEAPTVTAEAPAAAEADEEEDAEAPQAVAEDDLFADAPGPSEPEDDLFADAPGPSEPEDDLFADAPGPSEPSSDDDLFADAPGPSEPSPDEDLFADAPGPSEPSPEEDALDAYASSPSGAVPFDPSANHVADQKVFADDERGSHTGTPGRLYLAPQDPWDSEESRRRTAHGVLTPARSDRAETGAGDRAGRGEPPAAPDASRAALAAAAARARAARERKQNAEGDWTI